MLQYPHVFAAQPGQRSMLCVKVDCSQPAVTEPFSVELHPFFTLYFYIYRPKVSTSKHQQLIKY